jgi:hypothetical protein
MQFFMFMLAKNGANILQKYIGTDLRNPQLALMI